MRRQGTAVLIVLLALSFVSMIALLTLHHRSFILQYAQTRGGIHAHQSILKTMQSYGICYANKNSEKLRQPLRIELGISPGQAEIRFIPKPMLDTELVVTYAENNHIYTQTTMLKRGQNGFVAHAVHDQFN